MELTEYLNALPWGDRSDKLKEFAARHRCSINTIYAWARNNSHPPLDQKLLITEEFTNYQVTRFDLRPDIFNQQSLVYLQEKIQGSENQ